MATSEATLTPAPVRPTTAREVAEAVQSVTPGAILVPRRLIARVARLRFGTRLIGLEIPHGECAVLQRPQAEDLFKRQELGVDVDRLPGWLVLLPEPSGSWLQESNPDEVMIAYWRRLFHARIDRHFFELSADELQRTATEVLATLDEAEIDESQAVLRDEALLPPRSDDGSLVRELVATWLELRHFSPETVETFFPAIAANARFAQSVDALLDHSLILKETRPPGAPGSPVLQPEETRESASQSSPFPTEEDLESALEAAEKVGNLVRAALLGKKSGKKDDLDQQIALLSARLERDLLRSEKMPAASDWAEVLGPVLAESTRGRFSREVRFLFDLQRAVHEREQLTADLAGWLRTFGRKKIKRELPARERVRGLLHLRRAWRRIGKLRIDRSDAEALSRLVRRAIAALEDDIRERYRPVLHDSLEAVELIPRNLPERAAQDKVIDELLDIIVERGFLRIGDIRDAVSRNQLKLSNIESPIQLVARDELLRLDRELADSLDGVYQRGEVYLRGLQRASSIAFGTSLGRFLTRFVALPFGGAYLILEGLQHTVGPLLGLVGLTLPHLVSLWSVAGLGFYLMALIHAEAIRIFSWRTARAAWKSLRWTFFELPRWLASLPLIRAFLDSRVFQLARNWLLRPLLFAALVWWLFPVLGAPGELNITAAAVLFISFMLLLNSYLGTMVEEVASDTASRLWSSIRYRIIPGLVRWVIDVFKRLMNQLERAIYAVDEKLRYRRGQSQITFVLKVALGFIWSILSYVVRIYITLLIEPQVNPVKHFPVVTVSHKIILPFTLVLTELAAAPLTPVLGPVIANTVAGFTVFLLPGVFGFLVWELKENYKLYESNRSESLEPVRVGSHGETVAQLLRPGFHSGTVPKLYSKMRRASRKARRRDIQANIKHERDLHHVADAAEHFLERELCRLFNRSSAGTDGSGDGALSVSQVSLSSMRILVEIQIEEHGAPCGRLRVAFEEHEGWLVAEHQFVDGNPSTQARDAMLNGLEGLYRLAGVDMVRNELRDAIRDTRARLSIIGKGVVIRDDLGERILPVAHHPELDPAGTADRLEGAVIGHRPLLWKQWVKVWS